MKLFLCVGAVVQWSNNGNSSNGELIEESRFQAVDSDDSDNSAAAALNNRLIIALLMFIIIITSFITSL